MNFFGKKLREPLEIKQDIQNVLDREIVSVGGGVRIFPHAGLEIRLFAPDEATKGRYRAAFIENKTLEKAIFDYLRPPRCTEAVKPSITVSFEDDAEKTDAKSGFQIVFAVETGTPAIVETEAQIEVLEGLANVKKMRLAHRETYIGRCREMRRKDGKVIRKNDLFFLDAREMTGRLSKDVKESDSVNTSVSRIHAHIEYNERDGNYYLYDDGSTKGTTILREGRGLGEMVGKTVGKILEDKDIINFGKARVRFRLTRKD